MKSRKANQSSANVHLFLSLLLSLSLSFATFIGCSGIGPIKDGIVESGHSHGGERSNLAIKFTTTPTFEGDYVLNLSISNPEAEEETDEVVYNESQTLSYAPASVDFPSTFTATFTAHLAYGPYLFSMTLRDLESNVIDSDSQTIEVNQRDMTISFRLNFDDTAISTSFQFAGSPSIIAELNHPPVITFFEPEVSEPEVSSITSVEPFDEESDVESSESTTEEEPIFDVIFNESNFVVYVMGDTLQIIDPEMGDMCYDVYSLHNNIEPDLFDVTDPYIMKWLECTNSNLESYMITNANFEYESENNCQFTITVSNTLEHYDYENAVTVSDDRTNFQSCTLNIYAGDQYRSVASLYVTFDMP